MDEINKFFDLLRTARSTNLPSTFATVNIGVRNTAIESTASNDEIASNGNTFNEIEIHNNRQALPRDSQLTEEPRAGPSWVCKYQLTDLKINVNKSPYV